MASATVTLKISPNELQIVKDALKMYAYVLAHLDREGYEHPLEHYTYDLCAVDSDPRKGIMKARKILTDIGLK